MSDVPTQARASKKPLWVLLGIVGTVVLLGFAGMSGLWLLPVGAVFGPYLGFTHPLSDLNFQLRFGLTLLVALALFVWGVQTRRTTPGRIAWIVGLLLWTCTGFYGLSLHY